MSSEVRNEPNADELAKELTNRLFALGTCFNRPCTRIQFMSGDWEQGTEKGNGGLIRASFEQWMAKQLNEMLAQRAQGDQS